MDPNQWRNFNPSYGHLGTGSSLASSSANLNRFDLPLLTADQTGLNPGLGIGASLPPHGSGRTLGGLTGAPANFPLQLHNSVPQYLDAVSPLQSPLGGQNPYKSLQVGQSPFSLESPGLRSPDGTNPYSLPHHLTSDPGRNKTLFGHEQLKDTVGSYGVTSSERSQKGWGLSNFVAGQSNVFGTDLTIPTSGSSIGPPPAHTGVSASRNSTIQRNPFSTDLYQQIHVSTTGKLLGATSPGYSVSSSKASEVGLASPSNSLLANYGLSEHGIEDLTKSQSHTTFESFASSLPVKSESSYQTTSIASNMNYDPVSPVSDPGQPNDNFSSVEIHDFPQLNPVSHPIKMDLQQQKQERMVIQDTHHLLLQSNLHKSEGQQSLSQELDSVRNSLHSSNMSTSVVKNHNGNPHIIQTQNLHNTHSPLHQQTVQIGSPHIALQMGSPQAQLPSSTVVSTPPTPVQAVPDSTTKPKKPRGRKRKDQNAMKEQARQNEKVFQETMRSPTLANQSIMAGHPQGSNQTAHVMSMGGSFSPHTTYPYSPQKKQTTSPQTPQSYSPQMAQQNMMDSSYGSSIQSHNSSQKSVPSSPLLNNSQHRNVPNSPLVNSNQHSNLMNEQFSLQQSQNIVNPNLSSTNHMSLSVSSCSVSASINQVPVISDSVIRGGANRNMPPQSILQTSVSQHSPVNQSPPVQISVNSMQNDNATSLLGNNPNFTYGQPSQSQSFVDQLQSNTDIDIEKATIDDPLGMQALVLAEGDNYSVQAPQNTLYSDIDGYNNHFENQGSRMGYGESPVLHRSTSTIDEDALSSLIGPSSSARENMITMEATDDSTDRWQNQSKLQQKYAPPIAITTHPEIDDEFEHLRKPPVLEKPMPKQMHKYDTVHPPSVLHNPSNPPVPHHPHPISKSEMKKNPSSGFMDSFLSFIQGKKPETLSSVNSTVVKRPELPKYIPEPPRRRPVETVENKTSSDSAASTPKQDSENSSNMGQNSPCTSYNDSAANSDEDSNSYISSTVQNMSELNEDGKPSLKVKISLSKGKSRISGKIKSSNIKSGVTKLKSPKKKSPRSGKSRRSSSHAHVNYVANEYENSSGDDEFHIDSKETERMEEDEKFSQESTTPVPRRQMSSRKAKEKAQEKKKYIESDSDDEILSPIVPAKKRSLPETETYDSDEDPEWAPFAVENRRQSYEGDLMPKKGKRTKGRKRSNSRKSFDHDESAPQLKLKKTVKTTPSPQSQSIPVADMRNQKVLTEKSVSHSSMPVEYKPGYRVGDYLINNKDMNKFESFPVWKIETGKIIKKYELFTDQGKIWHRSLCTFSTWLPNMERDYTPIRAKVIVSHRDSETIEVFEEDRPKPKLDSKLENAYEEDPLADMFNVYLQIFLSQALEPGFLSAILESRDDFYLAPLTGIDKIIDKKLKEIDARVQWKQQFKEGLKAKPHIRELDRPNLKQACHACEHASQPAIKSVHLFGQSYNHITLEEDNRAESGSLEFMIGKMAATYVGPYHNLYHFKYNLSKRCLAKVDIVRQGNSNLDNAEILDRCLNNRTWVLKIFDDLKNMLDKG